MKFSALTLLAVLMAASTASAGNHSYSYGSCLADSGCHQQHSWKNGCCDREPSCADHIWDGYCASNCCGAHLPVPVINWNHLHTNAAPYRVPCFRLPKLHMQSCCTSDSCTAQPTCTEVVDDCAGSCTQGCCGGTPVLDWLHRTFHRAPKNCGCDMGCGCDQGCGGNVTHAAPYDNGSAHYGHANEEIEYPSAPAQAAPTRATPTDAAPLPPAPKTEPRDMKKNDGKKNDGKKNDKKNNKKDEKKGDSKTASLWLFPSLSL